MPNHIQRRQPYIKAQSGWPPGRPPIGISEVYWTMLVFFAPLKADDINNIMRDGLEKGLYRIAPPQNDGEVGEIQKPDV